MITSIDLPTPHRKDEMESMWPERMLLSEIAMEEDSFIRDCRIIFYSKKTSEWERNFAKDNANRQIWRIEHHWIVPASQCHPSEKVLNLIKKILVDRGLDEINPSNFIKNFLNDDWIDRELGVSSDANWALND